MNTTREMSPADYFRSLPLEERQRRLAGMSKTTLAALRYHWADWWARPSQLPPPGNWAKWLILTGRGWGKTRTGAEWVRSRVESGKFGRLALVARTAADARDTLVEGESGILSVSPPWCRPHYEPSKRRLTWPNGAMATTFSGEEPDALRGPQHDAAWADELASWQYASDAFDMLMFGLRLGQDPRVVITTTPKAVKIVKDLTKDAFCHVTPGTTYDNIANLAPTYRAQIVAKYEGTRIGRQELDGQLIEDAEGALWKRDIVEGLRVARCPELVRIVVALDPSTTSKVTSDECGILVAGISRDMQGYVLKDATARMSPAEWGALAISLYAGHGADRIVAETNNGGEMVELTLRTVRDNQGREIGRNVAYRAVSASRGKAARAEPVAALYEQGRIHHVGTFPELEDELCTWEPLSGKPSPNRLDALVWAFTDLLLGSDHWWEQSGAFASSKSGGAS